MYLSLLISDTNRSSSLCGRGGGRWERGEERGERRGEGRDVGYIGESLVVHFLLLKIKYEFIHSCKQNLYLEMNLFYLSTKIW